MKVKAYMYMEELNCVCVLSQEVILTFKVHSILFFFSISNAILNEQGQTLIDLRTSFAYRFIHY